MSRNGAKPNNFLFFTIASSTTEMSDIKPPNEILPILRKIKNRDRKGGLTEVGFHPVIDQLLMSL